ncbi:MAG: helix-turn-helix domain-containing protein [Bacteriovoracia bacterium]
MQQKSYDPLASFRDQAMQLIQKKYPSVEKFCFEEDFHKSTLSRLLTGKRTEFQIATLKRIADALGKRLVVRLE